MIVHGHVHACKCAIFLSATDAHQNFFPLFILLYPSSLIVVLSRSSLPLLPVPPGYRTPTKIDERIYPVYKGKRVRNGITYVVVGDAGR